MLLGSEGSCVCTVTREREDVKCTTKPGRRLGVKPEKTDFSFAKCHPPALLRSGMPRVAEFLRSSCPALLLIVSLLPHIGLIEPSRALCAWSKIYT